MCESSEPFCTGTIYTFPAGTTGTAQPGAFYGCLLTQPAPAWYHLLIADPGPINIYMYSTPLRDIDFICWGPYTDPYEPCVTGLTSNKVVDCSYSPNPTENCYIPNGQTGEYYILLITNYSQQPCNITFSQTSGSGSTDCTILPPPVNNNGPLCVGETLQLSASFVINANYYWSGPAGFLSTQQNPAIPNVTMANAGDYSCVITVNGQSSDPAVTSVIIYDLPMATQLTGDTTICLGTQAGIKFQLVGWGPFEIDYNDGTNFYTATNLWGPVGTVYVSPTSQTTYNFTQVRDAHCSRTLLFMSSTVSLHPMTSATMSGTASICAGEPANLTFNLTGTPPWNITYTINGENPQIITATTSPHTITVYPATTTLYELNGVTDYYCTGQVMGSAQVTVMPSPVANAGTDQTLPYGATTVLNGQASGGSGNYQYAWSPPEKLVNPNIAQPTTVNLTETTLFTLMVTDNSGGCQGSDEVMVNITGGALGCSPYASESVICHDQTTQLFAMASGGSGDYTYNWSSSPAGFASTLASPVVQPDLTTTYYVAVNDGYNVTNGNITITVNPRPMPNAGTGATIPHGTSTQLSGSASGGSGSYTYSWEPSEWLVNPNIASPLTLNLYSTTLFSLTVTDLATGCISALPAHVTVTVTGDALAVNPIAEPSVLCRGESTTLFALAGGGSGIYTYAWTSDPPGFVSAEPNPALTPLETRTYNVQINDGFNFASGSCIVTVLDAPVVNLGPALISKCVFDTVYLDAGNQGASYLWSNGSTERQIYIASTGIGFDLQNYSVTVTNPSGCQATSSITVVFDFSLCTGIEEDITHNRIRIFPNPGTGNIHLQFDDSHVEVVIRVVDLLGRTVLGPIGYNLRENDCDLIIYLGDRPDGVYIIHLLMDNKSAITRKYVLKK